MTILFKNSMVKKMATARVQLFIGVSLKILICRVKNDRFFFKYPLIPAPFCAECLHLHENKKVAIGISKIDIVLPT